MNRKILVRLLGECERSLGWCASGAPPVVVQADDGRTAVKALRTEMALSHTGAGFDLILMDFTMVSE